jgi:hypothetical protein
MFDQADLSLPSVSGVEDGGDVAQGILSILRFDGHTD